MKVVNAEGKQIGRVASVVAKKLLLGEEIAVVNSEKAFISGDKYMILRRKKELRALNTINPSKGPYFSRDSEKIMKRCIRGMLPDFRIGRGREAFKKIKCYSGFPEEFKKLEELKIDSIKNTPEKKLTLSELSKEL
jgi:large subunit ribosomal protein L13